MDEERRKKIQKQAKEDFQFGLVRLHRLQEEKKVRAEMSEDEATLFSLFRSQELEYGGKCADALRRLLLNYAKVAKYAGVRLGVKLSEELEQYRSDAARYQVFLYLLEHPKAKNPELVKFLDRRREGLNEALSSKFYQRGVKVIKGECWWAALRLVPYTRPYLAKIRKDTKNVHLRNALVNWPELLKKHKRERRVQ